MYVLHTNSRFACVSEFCSQRNLRRNFGFATWGVISRGWKSQRAFKELALFAVLWQGCVRCTVNQPYEVNDISVAGYHQRVCHLSILSGHGAKLSFSSLDSTNPVIVFLGNFDFNGSFAWTFLGGNHSHKLRAWGVSSDNNCNITLQHTWRKLSRKTSWTRVTDMRAVYQWRIGQHTSWVLVSMLSICWYQDSPEERLK